MLRVFPLLIGSSFVAVFFFSRLYCHILAFFFSLFNDKSWTRPLTRVTQWPNQNFPIDKSFSWFSLFFLFFLIIGISTAMQRNKFERRAYFFGRTEKVFSSSLVLFMFLLRNLSPHSHTADTSAFRFQFSFRFFAQTGSIYLAREMQFIMMARKCVPHALCF